jgi:TIR domain-containing protein
MPGRVFISHASEDHAIAEAVCEAIEGRGVSCWIAPRDITPGKDYAEALYDAIAECTSLVLVFSEHSNRSPQVRREVERAARDGDPIIPFRIDDTVPAASLQFNVGALDWLAPSSVDLATQVGILAELVQARMKGDTVPRLDAEKAWRGSPSVIRRVTATWMSALLWISISMAAADLLGNADAFSNTMYSRSIFAEEEVFERVLGFTVIQLIVLLPAAFVWLAWLMASFLTLEAAGIEGLRFGAPRAAGRFMWPGIRFEGGSAVVAALWEATRRLNPSAQSASDTVVRAPRWLVLLWLLPIALVPISIVTANQADAEEWSRQSLLTLAIVTDLLWLLAGVLCLYCLKAIEKRMRRREAGIA